MSGIVVNRKSSIVNRYLCKIWKWCIKCIICIYFPWVVSYLLTPSFFQSCSYADFSLIPFFFSLYFNLLLVNILLSIPAHHSICFSHDNEFTKSIHLELHKNIIEQLFTKFCFFLLKNKANYVFKINNNLSFMIFFLIK